MNQVHLACPDPPASGIARIVKEQGFEITCVSRTLEELVRADLQTVRIALVSDLLPGAMPVADAIKRLRARHPDVRVVLLLQEPDDALTQEAMKASIYDWTGGDALSQELPSLLRQARTFAEVTGQGETPMPEQPAQADFGLAVPHPVLIGLPEAQSKAVAALIEERLSARAQVSGEAHTFEDLIRLASEGAETASGIVTSLALPSAEAFDLVTRVRLLKA